MRPEVGTYRAIQAVLDQVENPSSFPGNRDAWEKHGAGRGTFKKWKKILGTSWQRWKKTLDTAGHGRVAVGGGAVGVWPVRRAGDPGRLCCVEE